ncbi:MULTISPECIES: peptide ABC transporter substrate-binding protein [Cohnella]|uniref:Oligopeptide transport system substrate-binding protein n=1 Tax=Cohnella phaseoli TaxID=456490 RepID=A0A3D9KEJ1_9BACL|nr:peptide ABC transporter substrate-binding protein [Cohnella phaseoli]RED84309.1 oligopeptide transport system substrate-binding protein [Cohnella phaseoli]
MMKYQKVLSTAMAVTLAGSLLAACSDNKDKNTASPSASAGNSPAESQASQENKTPQEFRFTLASEPPSLDPALMTDAQSSIVASGLYDGLTRLNPEGVPEPAIAKEWTVSDDGKTYTFKLRDDAKWSNGDPVTANDFEYSWKRALNPETASEYAYMLFYLENGEKYNSEQATEDEVGVKALDATTLEVKLASATPYFNSLIAHYTYWPVHPASVDGKPEWAADAKTIVSNGPFLLKDWAHGDKLVLTKNPDYYNKDKVNFDTVTISLVESESTVFSMFQTDKIDWIGAQAGSVPTDQVPQLVADKKATIKEIASTYYYLFNTKQKPFDNVKVRKAFAMSIDRQAIIDNVAKANQTPAFALIPPSINGLDGKGFREMYPDSGYFSENIEEAKKLLAEGLAEEGLDKFPETTLLYNTSEGHKAIAEAIVDMWRKNLNVEVKLSNQEWATFLETRDAGQFGLARSGWGADFNHAINFSYDLIHPKSLNNDGQYENAEVGKALDDAIVAAEEKDRVDLIAKAEKIAIADDMAVLPIYYYTTVTMLKPGFEDVVSDYAGHLDWAFGKKN